MNQTPVFEGPFYDVEMTDTTRPGQVRKSVLNLPTIATAIGGLHGVGRITIHVECVTPFGETLTMTAVSQ